MLRYTPYGWHMAADHSTLAFNDQPFDKASDGYLLGNGRRGYKPRLMRFCSPDNLSPFQSGGINSYAYCQGDPINFVDPSGHSGVPPLQILAAQKSKPSPRLGNLRASNLQSSQLMLDDYIKILNKKKPDLYTMESLQIFKGPHTDTMIRNSARDAFISGSSKDFSHLVIKEHRDRLILAGIDELKKQQRYQARNAINLGIPPREPEILPLYRGLLEIRNLYEPPTVGYPTLLSRPSALHGRNYQEQVKILRNRTIA
ncbi:RHS repeat-associated core domain-containing protein [Pseudomonas hunanensis]|uniref:RHS repeat-associated core domain-containing protein n=1 Tax=Pseudomonas hunanensis TaxID=1247546 RepID=UPI003805EFC2